MPKHDKAASTAFCRLLRELQSEHEREVGALAGELERLRCGKYGSPTADNFDDFTAIMPCMPFPCMPKPRLVGIRSTRALQEVPLAPVPVVPPAPSLTPPCEQYSVMPPSSSAGTDPGLPPTPRREAPPPPPGPEALGAAAAAKSDAPGIRLPEVVFAGGREGAGAEVAVAEAADDGGVGDGVELWPIWIESVNCGSDQSDGGGSVRRKNSWLQLAIKTKVSGSSLEQRQQWQRKMRAPMNTIKGHFPLSPTSKMKIVWDLGAPFALLFDFILIPLQVFDFQEVAALRALQALLMFYWISDMLISFNSAYFDERGEVVTCYRRIAAQYVRTWFFPDLAITGFDIVTTIVRWVITAEGAASENADLARWGKFLRVCRVIRILRLGRMAKLQEIIYGIQVYFDSEAVAILWGLCWNVFTLLVLNHLTACMWYWLGTIDQEEYTWLTVPIRGGRTYAEVSKAEAYFVSLHWSLTLFTPASMAVQPENLLERIYAVVCLILAMVFFASFVSTVTAGMTRLRHLKTEALEQSFKLRKFMRENKITLDLVARVIRYVDIAMKSHKKRIPMEDVVRLKWLSLPLYMELKLQLSAPTLRRHRFFQKYAACSLSATRHLCYLAITTQRVSREDTLFAVFGEAESMFFIKNGQMVYRRGRGLDCQRKVQLQEGDWSVEPVLWIRWVHRGTMKAFTESELLCLEAARFRDVSLAHPDVLGMAATYAADFARGCDNDHTCDVPQEVYDRQTMFRLNGSGGTDADAASAYGGDSNGSESVESDIAVDFGTAMTGSKGSKGTSGVALSNWPK